MKQLSFILFVLFFSYSNAQSPFFSKGRIKAEVVKSALRTSATTVVALDSNYSEYENEIYRFNGLEKTEFGFVGTSDIKLNGSLDWIRDEKYFYYTNSLGQVDSAFEYDFDRETGVLNEFPDYKDVYRYDQNGNVISYTFFFTIIEGVKLPPHSREESFYTDTQLDSTVFYDWENSKWNKSRKTVFLYDDNKLLKTKMSFDYDNDLLTDTDSTEFYYANHIFPDSSIKWEDGELYSKKTFSFDANGNDTLSSFYYWSESPASWVLSEQNHFSFSSQYRLDQLEFNLFRLVDNDDEYMINVPIEKISFRWVGWLGQLEKESTETYYYSEKVVLGFPDSFKQGLAFYPNPARSSLRVSNDVSKTSILDLYGKTILKSDQQTIDVSSLPKGSYILLLETNKGLVSEKLIISK